MSSPSILFRFTWIGNMEKFSVRVKIWLLQEFLLIVQFMKGIFWKKVSKVFTVVNVQRVFGSSISVSISLRYLWSWVWVFCFGGVGYGGDEGDVYKCKSARRPLSFCIVILKKWCLKQSRSWIPSNCIPLPSVTSQLPIWCWSSCSIRFGGRELKKFVWVCASVVGFCGKWKGDGTLDGEQEWILARDTSVQGHHECKCCTQAAVVAIGDSYFCLLCWSSFCACNSLHAALFSCLVLLLSLSLSFSQWFSL